MGTINLPYIILLILSLPPLKPNAASMVLLNLDSLLEFVLPVKFVLTAQRTYDPGIADSNLKPANVYVYERKESRMHHLTPTEGGR